MPESMSESISESMPKDAGTLERPALQVNGFLMLAAIAILVPLGLWLLGDWIALSNLNDTSAWQDLHVGGKELGGLGAIAIAIVALLGFLPVEPNQAYVLLFLGKYVGSVRTSGFWWVNPFTSKNLLSLRVRNFNSDTIKVNDGRGNPIEIAAVVVWRAVNTAKALFDVDDYEEFVEVQSETAIRALAIRYPYDADDDIEPSLRGSTEEVSAALQQEVQARLNVAGVEVLETRISHLAYAPEIAQVMLRRQQAQAIVAARRQIVEGAVSVVEMAIQQLIDRNLLDRDAARQFELANNLLVILTAEQNVQPVVSAGGIKK